MVTVVDAHNFFNNLKSIKKLKDSNEKMDEADERTISHLLVDQVEFADVIILNKRDLVSEEVLLEVKGALKSLNPMARIVATQNSKIKLNKILNTKRFNFEKASMAPGWLKQIRGEQVPETLEYGVSSFIYRARKPFHSDRLWTLLGNSQGNIPSVIRSKGFAW